MSIHRIDPSVVVDLVRRNWTVETIAHVLNRPVEDIAEIARAGGVKPAPTKRAAAQRRRCSGWRHLVR